MIASLTRFALEPRSVEQSVFNALVTINHGLRRRRHHHLSQIAPRQHGVDPRHVRAVWCDVHRRPDNTHCGRSVIVLEWLHQDPASLVDCSSLSRIGRRTIVAHSFPLDHCVVLAYKPFAYHAKLHLYLIVVWRVDHELLLDSHGIDCLLENLETQLIVSRLDLKRVQTSVPIRCG